jgi:FAD/FMN-containing dehydrogenase
MSHVESKPYEEVNGQLNPLATFGERKTGGGTAIKMPLDPAFAREVFNDYVKFVEENEDCGASFMLFELVPYKKTASVALDATAHGNRGEYYNVGILLRWKSPDVDSKARAWSRFICAKIRDGGGVAKEKGVGIYSNYDEDSVPEKVFGVNTPRLIELKRKYDPGNVFYKWHDLLKNA